mmetsp:Transcript_41115/g.129158  ORF Transcript_41115/g.129158 Transcript_41115/m.129158 type:complete len:290 (+) Transcript_41115:2770-3639(+)
MQRHDGHLDSTERPGHLMDLRDKVVEDFWSVRPDREGERSEVVIVEQLHGGVGRVSEQPIDRVLLAMHHCHVEGRVAPGVAHVDVRVQQSFFVLEVGVVCVRDHQLVLGPAVEQLNQLIVVFLLDDLPRSIQQHLANLYIPNASCETQRQLTVVARPSLLVLLLLVPRHPLLVPEPFDDAGLEENPHRPRMQLRPMVQQPLHQLPVMLNDRDVQRSLSGEHPSVPSSLRVRLERLVNRMIIPVPERTVPCRFPLLLLPLLPLSRSLVRKNPVDLLLELPQKRRRMIPGL